MSLRQALIFVILAVVGFGAVAQIRALEGERSYTTLRQQDLIALIVGTGAARERLESDLARATDENAERRRELDEREHETVLRLRRAERLGVPAGTREVSGPGLRVEISSEAAPTAEVVHDIFNELRVAGATSIEVNDRVRVGALPAVETRGAALVVGGARLSAPYVVEAVGDPASLRGALTFPGGPGDALEEAGGELILVEGRVVITSTIDPTLSVATPEQVGR